MSHTKLLALCASLLWVYQCKPSEQVIPGGGQGAQGGSILASWPSSISKEDKAHLMLSKVETTCREDDKKKAFSPQTSAGDEGIQIENKEGKIKAGTQCAMDFKGDKDVVKFASPWAQVAKENGKLSLKLILYKVKDIKENQDQEEDSKSFSLVFITESSSENLNLSGGTANCESLGLVDFHSVLSTGATTLKDEKKYTHEVRFSAPADSDVKEFFLEKMLQNEVKLSCEVSLIDKNWDSFHILADAKDGDTFSFVKTKDDLKWKTQKPVNLEKKVISDSIDVGVDLKECENYDSETRECTDPDKEEEEDDEEAVTTPPRPGSKPVAE